MYRELSEEAFLEVLDLRDAGKTNEEILARFPEFKEELAEFFHTEEALMALKENASPSPQALKNLLATLPESNTEATAELNTQKAPRSRMQNIFALLIPTSLAFASIALLLFAPGYRTTQKNQSAKMQELLQIDTAAAAIDETEFDALFSETNQAIAALEDNL